MTCHCCDVSVPQALSRGDGPQLRTQGWESGVNNPSPLDDCRKNETFLFCDELTFLRAEFAEIAIEFAEIAIELAEIAIVCRD